jgi:hypothetical protein
MAAAPSSASYDKPTTFGDIAITGLVIGMSIVMVLAILISALVVAFIAASVVFPA